jgi:AAA+ ATPase superfamily predicted ATPase
MMLKFYNREKETALLETVEQRSRETTQMTFVVGRRRIGKTASFRSKTYTKEHEHDASSI